MIQLFRTIQLIQNNFICWNYQKKIPIFPQQFLRSIDVRDNLNEHWKINQLPFQMNSQNCRRTENEKLFGCVAVNRWWLFRLLFLLVILAFFLVGIFCVVFVSLPRWRQLRTPIAGPLVRPGQEFRRRELWQRRVDGALACPAVVARGNRRERSCNPFLPHFYNLWEIHWHC